jgi:hypothetical protein
MELKCPKCEKTFASEEEMKEHGKSHIEPHIHQKGQLLCTKCGVVLPSAEVSLAGSEITMAEGPMQLCPNCAKETVA